MIERDNLKPDNLNHEIPMTEADQKRFSETYGATDWYDWAVKNWGTKWSPDLDQEFEDGDEQSIPVSATITPQQWQVYAGWAATALLLLMELSAVLTASLVTLAVLTAVAVS